MRAGFTLLKTAWVSNRRFTIKVAKRRLRIYEVGISYWGITYEDGKKIGWKDGVRCLSCLLKYSIKERLVAPGKVKAPPGIQLLPARQDRSDSSAEIRARPLQLHWPERSFVPGGST